MKQTEFVKKLKEHTGETTIEGAFNVLTAPRSTVFPLILHMSVDPVTGASESFSQGVVEGEDDEARKLAALLGTVQNVAQSLRGRLEHLAAQAEKQTLREQIKKELIEEGGIQGS